LSSNFSAVGNSVPRVNLDNLGDYMKLIDWSTDWFWIWESSDSAVNWLCKQLGNKTGL